MKEKNTIVYFTVCSIFILATSFIFAFDKFTWLLEVFPILIFTYRKFLFTSLIYWLLILHFLILAVGGIYTYAKVPLGFWIQDWFGFERNNYDKIGHFVQGFIPALLAREILLRTSPLQIGKWLNFIVVSICLAISALYELIEWWAAIAQGASAEAFLGTQDYEWDAQSDMFLALIGAIASLLLLSGFHNKLLRRKEALLNIAAQLKNN